MLGAVWTDLLSSHQRCTNLGNYINWDTKFCDGGAHYSWLLSMELAVYRPPGAHNFETSYSFFV